MNDRAKSSMIECASFLFCYSVAVAQSGTRSSIPIYWASALPFFCVALCDLCTQKHSSLINYFNAKIVAHSHTCDKIPLNNKNNFKRNYNFHVCDDLLHWDEYNERREMGNVSLTTTTSDMPYNN